jgi:hypothetical protein
LKAITPPLAFLLQGSPSRLFSLSAVDIAVIVLYFAVYGCTKLPSEEDLRLDRPIFWTQSLRWYS